ncbi:soyasapogenol B glucuronide galactosyltransferase-like [Vicia villosa]|uniref:soyasapogenol B glucuronide galactosyltransferase-like n=1 Tax=Vicia villosa TaxID=3911 RepID=UPI00273CCAB9|nr:soyasapogenol B glucuronide galactosyltransferase-like [Vicia villosa]
MLSHGGAEPNNLNVIFLPFLCTSHTIPMIDMARIFAMHGVNITIFTTAGNVGIFQKCIDRDISLGRYIKTHILEFPAQQVGLPIGIETMNANTSLDTAKKIYEASLLLQPQIESYLFDKLFEVDCIVSDMFYTWTVEAAAKLGVPRIVFCPASIFSRCAELSFELHATEADSENVKIVGLPHKLEIARLQLPDWLLEPSEFGSIMKEVNDSTRRSYGAVFNSFYDMEGAYEEHYKNVFGTKCWSLGPVSFWANEDLSDKAERGDEKVEEGDVLLQWLNSKKENSVIYVSFGSISKFPISQLIEIAHALEASTHDFIWVVRKNNEDGGSGEGEEGFMEDFEKRVRESNKGYLIWGWAPQLLILENKAIGGIVTHCGWNTTIESINAGLPMVTWPLFSEQFFHEKLVVEVLRIGVSIGVRKWKVWNEFEGEVVKREDIGKAIGLMMENGKEAKEMRSRAKALSEDSKKAILVGGSSHANLIQFIEELGSLKLQRLNGSI